MDDPTSLLFGLDSFAVVDVSRVADGAVQVVIETRETRAACPDCGVLTSRVQGRPLVRIKDLPASGQPVALWWRKRRLRCAEELCPRRSFTQTTPEIPPRSRLTTRLRDKLAHAIVASNRAVAEVAAEYGVAWHTAHTALVAAAARWLPEPSPTRVLGIDETRARSVRWLLEPAGWRRSDPWLTSFVDADTTRPGVLLGLAPGRSGACVKSWLGAQTAAFRAGVEIAVIDPSAPYASGVRAALPHTRIAVDKWHLVRLGNEAVTEVRQRLARQRHGRRGRAVDPAWAHRRMLLTAGDRLSARQLTRAHPGAGRRRPDQRARRRLGLQGVAAPAAGLTTRAGGDPGPAVAVLHRLRGRGHARDHPAGLHRGDLVAGHPGRPHHEHDQRAHRGLQPDHQAGQACRMRIPQHRQLSAAHHGPHRSHPTAWTSSMNEAAPLKCEEPPKSPSALIRLASSARAGRRSMTADLVTLALGMTLSRGHVVRRPLLRPPGRFGLPGLRLERH